MKLFWVFIGIGAAVLQAFLVLLTSRADTRWRLPLMVGKLALWILFFLLLAWLGRDAILFAAIPALGLYSLAAIIMLLITRKKETQNRDE